MIKIYITATLLLLASAIQAQQRQAKITAILPAAFYSQGAALTISQGASMKVNGNAVFSAGGSLNNKGTLIVTGDMVNGQVMSTSGTGKLVFSGLTAQVLSGSETYRASAFEINNPAGVTLQTPLRVNGALSFTGGILSAVNSNYPLIIEAGASVSGASDASHVNGYVQKLGTGTFVFPIGNASKYQPVEVDLTANSNGLNARYVAGDAGAATYTATGGSATILDAYNNQEYWDLSPVGTATGKVMIRWDDYKNPAITASQDIHVFKVAHKTAAGWLNEGSSVVTGNTLAGTVTSAAISSWSPFTLGAISESALPVTLTRLGSKNPKAALF